MRGLGLLVFLGTLAWGQAGILPSVRLERALDPSGRSEVYALKCERVLGSILCTLSTSLNGGLVKSVRVEPATAKAMVHDFLKQAPKSEGAYVPATGLRWEVRGEEGSVEGGIARKDLDAAGARLDAVLVLEGKLYREVHR